MNNEPFQPFAQDPQPIETPQQAPLPSPLPPQDNNFIAQPPEKKPNRTPAVIAIILGILLVVAGGVIAYLLYTQSQKSATPTQTTSQQSTDANANDKAASIVKTIQTALNDQLRGTYKSLSIVTGTNAPAYKAPDANYAVLGTGSELLVTVDPSAFSQVGVTAVERVATKVLDDQGLKSSTSSWQKIYQNDSIICGVSIGSSPTSIACGNIKDYATLIAQVKPFADAYLASTQGKTSGQGVAFGLPKIIQKTNGYSSASVTIGNTESPIGGFAGLFYAKDNNWTFWKGTQGVIACSEYTTNDLQRAFEGDTCYDAKDAKATVKVAL